MLALFSVSLALSVYSKPSIVSDLTNNVSVNKDFESNSSGPKFKGVPRLQLTISIW